MEKRILKKSAYTKTVDSHNSIDSIGSIDMHRLYIDSIYLGLVCVNFSMLQLLDAWNQSEETLLSKTGVRGVLSRF